MTVARILLCLSAAFALIAVGMAVLQVRSTVAILPSVVHREAEATREAAGKRIDAALRIVQHQVNEARLGADRQIGGLRGDLLDEVRGVRRDALAAIDQVSGRALTRKSVV